MNQSNFENYNYRPTPQPPQEPGFFERVFGTGAAALFKSPLFATVALVLFCGVFAVVILSSYNSGDDSVPIIEAETVAYRDVPSDPGGMDIPFQDSTVFSSLSGDAVPETRQVENLLASSEEPVDRLEAFAAEAERILRESEAAQAGVDIESAAEQETASLIEQATGVESPKPIQSSVEGAIDENTIIQQIASIDARADVSPATPSVPVAPSKPDSLYRPGSSPETLEFVKNVLEEKDIKVASGSTLASAETVSKASKEAAAVAAIKPAAGFAISAGTHYVQLGSVKSQAGASSEWGKLKGKYPAELSDAKYRVNRADLGERGVFYRIQAGPMSGESASEICGSIKAQNPGACLVVK